MQIVLIRKNEIQKHKLPSKISGQHMISYYDKGILRQLIAVTASDGRWIIRSGKRTELPDSYSVDENGIRYTEIRENEYYPVKYIPTGEKMIIFAESSSPGMNSFEFYQIDRGRRILIGDHTAADVYFHNSTLSETIRASIEFGNNDIIVRDENSINGTYLNSKRITEAPAEYGDELYLVGLRVIIGKSFIAVNNPDNSVSVRLPRLNQTPFVPREDTEEEDETNNTFSSAPRYKRDIQMRKITIEDPPKPRDEQNLPWAVIMGPSITMAFGSVFSAVFTIQNVMKTNGDISPALPTLVMSVCMVLGTIIWPVFAKRFEKRARVADENRQKREYIAYLERIEKEINDEIHLQEEITRENHPTLEACIDRINRRDMSLWERSTYHNDFLEVTLGNGDLPMSLELSYARKGAIEKSNDASEAMYRLVEKPRILRNVPIPINFLKSKIVGFTGERDKVIALTKAVLLQLCALHNYDDLKILFIYNEQERTFWESVKWLPHIFNNDKTWRYVVNDMEEAKALSNVISNIGAVYSNNRDKSDDKTHYIIIAADKDLAEKIQSLKEFTHNPQKYENISLLALYNERRYLPKACSVICSFRGETLEVADFNDTTGASVLVKEPVLYSGNPDSIFVNMANIELDISSDNRKLPTDISYFDMFRAGTPEHLDVLSKWEENDSVRTLAAPIGVDANGYHITLDIHEKAHGPHGLIAGMTGSGKSEFIISYIASLAMSYSPEEIAFVLIDFKGGGMADVFRQLPHLAGSITNLDGNELQRSFIAIESELEKRQKIFKAISEQTKISNIDIYKYQKLRKNEKTLKPLPHLIIISDEFAELKQQHPDFMEQLIRIARIGRSLGVHLILATQKPDGVVDDQIKSNIKFKVCLKVQDKSDSQSVIDRPDATLITNAGRFYLQVGYNEIFEYGQSPWSGAPYFPTDQYVEGQKKTIEVLNEQAQVIYKVNPPLPPRPAGVPEKQIDALVIYLNALAREKDCFCEKLWLEPIKGPEKKDHRSRNESTDTVPFVIAPVVGTYDDLRNRQHKPLVVPFTNGGNSIIYGVSGSGKLDFLNQMIYSVIDKHTPEEVNFFLLDFDSGALSAFSEAPHVAAVAMSSDPDVLRGIFEQLEKELASRRELFKRYGSDYQTYIKSSGKTLPNLILVINNYSAFQEEFTQCNEYLTKIAREGNKYGLFVVMTSDSPTSINYRMSALFRNVYVLRQNKVEHYYDLLNKTGGILPSDFRGRGIFQRDGITYEFQTSILFEDSDNTYDAISRYCAGLAARTGYTKKELKLLPKQVTRKYLEAEGASFDDLRHMPVAVDIDTKQPLYMDFSKNELTFLAYDSDSIGSKDEILNCVLHTATPVVLIAERSLFSDVSCINGSAVSETVARLEQIAYDRAAQAQAEMANGNGIPDFEHLYVAIDDITALSNSLSAQDAFCLNNLISGLSDNYHIHFIVTDSITNYRDFIEDDRLGKVIPVKSGIAIGRDVRCPYLLGLSHPDDITDDSYGYVMNDHQLHIGKIITKGATES